MYGDKIPDFLVDLAWQKWRSLLWEFVPEEVFESSSPKTGSKEQINWSHHSYLPSYNVSEVSVMLKCYVLLCEVECGGSLVILYLRIAWQIYIQHCLLVVQTYSYLHDPLNCLMKLSVDVPRQLLKQLSDQSEQNSKITKAENLII